MYYINFGQNTHQAEYRECAIFYLFFKKKIFRHHILYFKLSLKFRVNNFALNLEDLQVQIKIV